MQSTGSPVVLRISVSMGFIVEPAGGSSLKGRRLGSTDFIFVECDHSCQLPRQGQRSHRDASCDLQLNEESE